MKTTMGLKKLLVAIILAIPTFAYASEVEITVSGSGVDKETAIKTALRSALEQTYGTFVSTSSKIQNDELMSDEIVSLSRGNIQSYKILSENQLTNGHWYVLLQATVNINQLAKYVKGEGATVEVDMNAFNAKVLLEEMNAEAERKIIDHLIAELESIEGMWDYKLSSVEPGVDGDKYSINGEVRVYVNENTRKAVKLLKDVLSMLNVPAENRVNGKYYYRYDTSEDPLDFRSFHVNLRNEYDNKLLLFYSEWYGGDRVKWKGKILFDIFTNKIKFKIQPLSLIIQYGDNSQSSDAWAWDWIFEFINGKKIDQWVTKYRIYKSLSREEALKIKEITVQPIN